MFEPVLTKEIINAVKSDVCSRVSDVMQDDLVNIILYGSCARGDFTEDSDIDIALLTRCDRVEVKKYNEELAAIATELAIKYFSIVNFVCLPYDEYLTKNSWYEYFKNIKEQGEIIYG